MCAEYEQNQWINHRDPAVFKKSVGKEAK